MPPLSGPSAMPAFLVRRQISASERATSSELPKAPALAPEQAATPVALKPTPAALHHSEGFDGITAYSTLVTLCAPLGLSGKAKSFEELRRTIVNGPQHKIFCQIHVVGPLARFGALKAPCGLRTPNIWQLQLSLAGNALQVSPEALTQAMRGLRKALSKRAFAVGEGHNDRTLIVGDAQGAHAAITFVNASAPEVAQPLPCEALSLQLTARRFYALPGHDEALAWARAEMGVWRLPQSSAIIAPASAEAALKALATSWRHQQLGYCPNNVLDEQDVPAFAAAALEYRPGRTPKTAFERAQRALGEHVWLHFVNDEERRGFAAVALTQLGLYYAAEGQLPMEQPLFRAVWHYLREASVSASDATHQELAIVQHLALQSPNMGLMILLSAACPGSHVIRGNGTPIARVGLAHIEAQLFVAAVSPSSVKLQAPNWHRHSLANALNSQNNLASAIAQLLHCPALEPLLKRHKENDSGTHRAWAETLMAAAAIRHDDNPQRLGRRKRFFAAAALLCPNVVLIEPYINQCPLDVDDIASAIATVSADKAYCFESLRALILIHETHVPGASFLAALGARGRAKYVAALCALDVPQIALNLVGAEGNHLIAWPAPTLLMLLRQSVRSHTQLAPLLLGQLVMSDVGKQLLLQHSGLMLQLSADIALAEPLADVLAQDSGAEAIKKRWLLTAKQHQATNALQRYLAVTSQSSPFELEVAEALTDQVITSTCQNDLRSVEKAWQAIGDRAPKDSDMRLHAYSQVLLLNGKLYHLSPHSCTGNTQRARLRRMIELVLERSGQDERGLRIFQALALWPSLMHSPNIVKRILHSGNFKYAQQAMGKDFVTLLFRAIGSIRSSLTGLELRGGQALAILARQGLRETHLPLSLTQEWVVLSARLLMQNKYFRLAFDLLDQQGSRALEAHHLIKHLRNSNLSDPYQRGWVEVVSLCVDDIKDKLHLPGQASLTLTKHAFWTQAILALMKPLIRSVGQTITESGETINLYADEHVVQAMALQFMLAHFTLLPTDDPHLIALTKAATDPALNQRLLLIISHQNKKLKETLPAELFQMVSLRMLPIWAAVLRSAPAENRTDKKLQEFYAQSFPIRLEDDLGQLCTYGNCNALSALIDTADLWLRAANGDMGKVRFRVQQMATHLLTKASLPMRLERLHEHAMGAGLPPEESPVVMAAGRIIEQAPSWRSMAPAQQQVYQTEAFNVAYSVSLIRTTLDQKLQASSFARLLRVAPITSRQDLELWKLVAGDAGTLLLNLPDRGAVSMAEFARFDTMELSSQPSHLRSNHLSIVLLNNLLILATRSPWNKSAQQRYFKFDSLCHLQWRIDEAPYVPQFAVAQQTLALCCADEKFNQDLLMYLMQRCVRDDGEPISEKFLTWLFEALSAAAPPTALHLAVAEALTSSGSTTMQWLRGLCSPEAQERAASLVDEIMNGRSSIAADQDKKRDITCRLLERISAEWPSDWPTPLRQSA